MKPLPGNLAAILFIATFGFAALILAADSFFARESAATAASAFRKRTCPGCNSICGRAPHFDEKDPAGASVRPWRPWAAKAAMIYISYLPAFDHPGRYGSELSSPIETHRKNL